MKTKNIVITGASSGIGEALAELLAQQGHHLVLAARRQAALEEVAKACGSKAYVVPADVTNRVQIENLRDQTLGRLGHIDVWVNNAGQGIYRSVMELKERDFDEMMAVNVKSALYGMQAVIPHFQSQGQGQIINVSSFLGRVPLVSNRSAYNAAKAALNALTANLRMELKKDYPHIHVCLVMPGVVQTDFEKNALGAPPGVAGIARTATSRQTAQEVAQVIADLIASPRPEVYTNPTLAGTVRRYYEDVAAFEANL